MWVRSMNGDERQDLLARWSEVSDLRITLINSQYDLIYTAMVKLLHSRSDVQIKQYVLSNRDNRQTIHLINGLMPMLYEERYQGYIRVIDPLEERTTPLGIAAADVMVCQYRLPDGEVREDMIAFHEPYEGIELSVRGGASDLGLLGIREECYVPIKRTYFDSTDMMDYLQYSMDYAALERGRAIWKIKPDIGVDYIPGDIIVAAVREGPLPQEWDIASMADTLEEIYTRRYQDSFSKHCPAHTIFKRGAMLQFAQTGKTTDHFWGMRAYTPEERMRILNELLNQQLDNPYVHMYFFKDDELVRDVEIAYYEDLGILILPSDTDYNLAAGHSEVMISYPEMMRLYRDFFMEELVSKYVLSENDSVAFLRELIAVCKAQLEEREQEREDESAGGGAEQARV